MKIIITTKLSLPIIFISMLSCGKSVTNKNEARDIKKIEPINDNSIRPKIKISESGSVLGSRFNFIKSAWLTIPAQLQITSGSPSAINTKLVFNAGHEYEEKYCLYSASRNSLVANQYIYTFVGCFQDTQNDGNSENDDALNYTPGQSVAQNKNYPISYTLTEESSTNVPSEIEIELIADWI